MCTRHTASVPESAQLTKLDQFLGYSANGVICEVVASAYAGNSRAHARTHANTHGYVLVVVFGSTAAACGF